MRLIYSILVTLLLFSPSFSHAETKEIISEGTYNMGNPPTVSHKNDVKAVWRTP